jgi:hypothetical protein
MALAKVGRCGETLQIAQLVQGTVPNDDIAVGNVNQAIQACQQNLGQPTSSTLPTLSLTETPSTPTPTPITGTTITLTPTP